MYCSARPGHLPTCELPRLCQCEATAYHEAGHAVACFETGARLLRIDVRGERGRYGLVEAERHRSRRGHLLFLASGPAAEGLLIRRFPECGSGADVRESKRHAGREERWQIWKDALAMCVRRWSDIEMVATAMLGGRFLLFGSEVRALLGASPEQVRVARVLARSEGWPKRDLCRAPRYL